MAMRSILVHAGRDDDSATRVEAGLTLARALNGHLGLLINTPIGATIAMDPFGGAHMMGAVLDQLREQDDALQANLTAQLENEDVPWSIDRSEADLVDALVSSARLADLVIMSLGDAAPMLGVRPPVGAVAIAARTPILALASGKYFDPIGPAMVAWNGSHEAANALRAAVPLLRLATKVDVVTIADGRSGFPPTDALSYLSRHDVHAMLDEREAGQATVEEALMARADAMGATLMVMGAYGHSRLRETLFGGVTRYSIDMGGRALLLAH
jgi:nucleotide-binding universal stress UspA family protein